MNSTDLATKTATLQQEIANIEAARGRTALDAERGVDGAQRSLSDLNAEHTKLVEAIDQARLAHGAALRQEETAARAKAQLQEDERQANVVAEIEALVTETAEVDAMVIALRDKLASMVTQKERVRGLSRDPLVFGDFQSEVVARISTVLSGSGFAFRRLPFYGTDIQGRPDATEQALAPRVPVAHLLAMAGINKPRAA